MNNLLLITGAGASFDVADLKGFNSTYRPPLTKHLFLYYKPYDGISRDDFIPYSVTCLKNHTSAIQVGYSFYNQFKDDNSEANLEEYLSELRNSNKKAERAKFWSIPIYLYELFDEISRQYLPARGKSPSNYRELIDILNKVGKYNQIIWLNLNYDLLADFAIRDATGCGLNNFEEYMVIETADKMQIKYTKPHGSIDWFKSLHQGSSTYESIKEGKLPVDLENQLSDQIFKANVSSEGKIQRPRDWYPAITAPLGEYKYVYQSHIDTIMQYLETTDSVLCIGFSALDKDILNLIKNILSINTLQIVNGPISNESAKQALDRIASYCQNLNIIEEDALFNGGFTDFIRSGIHKWLNL